MSGVIAACLLPARGDDSGATDCHSFAVGATPVTINRIRKRGLDNPKQQRACSPGQVEHPLTHHPPLFYKDVCKLLDHLVGADEDCIRD
jgi:hypothetical protein